MLRPTNKYWRTGATRPEFDGPTGGGQTNVSRCSCFCSVSLYNPRAHGTAHALPLVVRSIVTFSKLLQSLASAAGGANGSA